MLYYGIKKVVQNIKLIDISDFTCWCDRTKLGVICVYHSSLVLTHCVCRAGIEEYCWWVFRRNECGVTTPS